MSSQPDKTVASRGGVLAPTVTTCTSCGATLAAADPACPQCGGGRGSPQERAERMRQRLQAQIGDGYELLELLGRGGMGIVFRARERALDRDVALKVLALDPILAPEAWARFEREARLAARLDHPHIVPVYAVGQGTGIAYYTMRLVRGGNVEDLLAERRPLDVGRTLEILRAVAAALDYAHRSGVAHRDVKPANILLHDGHALVADFGIAKALEAGEQTANLTGTGAIGSPAYMAPEQWRGEALDGRADQYALGIVAFEMLTGRRPFEAARVQDLFKLHQSGAVPDVTAVRRGLGPDVQLALERALAKYPSERFPSVTAFVDALAARRPSAPPPGMPERRRAPAPAAPVRRRRSIALPLALVVAALGTGAAFAPPTRPYVRAAADTVVSRVDGFLNPPADFPRHDAADSLASASQVAATPDSVATPVATPGDSATVDTSASASAASAASGAPARVPVAPLPSEGALPANFRRAPTEALSFIRVVTRGGSARARIDGRTLGFTPYVARVEPGMHYVSVEGAGDTFLPTQHAIDAAEGDTTDAVFTAPGWQAAARRAAVPAPVSSVPAAPRDTAPGARAESPTASPTPPPVAPPADR
jgi:hypothetical protein